MYNAQTAAIYDLLYAGNGGEPLRDVQAEAARVMAEVRAAKPDASSLLDVGCGTGRYLPYVDPSMTIHGLDLNPDFLAVARERCPSAVFHEADMEEFDLGRRFDAVTCLFSSIGYVVTPERLARTVEGFSRHLAPGGVMIIEPWFGPEAFWDGHVSTHLVDRPDVKVAWMHRQSRDANVSRLDIHYLVAGAAGVEHFSESHELGLFTSDEYTRTMTDVGLRVTFDPVGFGRGLFIGVAQT